MSVNPKNKSHVILAQNGPVTGDLSVSVRAEGSVARINIIGTIYSGWSDDNFRSACERLIADGITDAHVYMNTNGGDVFAANEIVNVIKMFKGSITGEGGAIVASAGTYIAVHLKSFKMASNGQFMVHKPYGYVVGDADELDRVAALLRSFEDSYAQAYSAKTGKSIDDVKALYEKGDYWMSARKAMDEGFIDAITGEEVISEETRAMYAACGRKPVGPVAVTPKSNANNKNSDMKTIALLLGLSADATEDQIVAELNRLKDIKAKYDLLLSQKSDAEQAAKADRRKKVLDGLVANKQIAADARDYYGSILDSAPDFEAKAKELEALPKPQSLSAVVESTSAGASGAAPDRGAWTFADWSEKDPAGLREMHKTNYEAFNALYKAKFGGDAPKFA